MINTYLTQEAAERLRHGASWAQREDIVSMDRPPQNGEWVLLRDQEGRTLGLGDVDMEAVHPIRRVGLPDEPTDGVIQRQLRRALERRALFLQDPRYCRVVNDDGDSLPGLVIDRYDRHFVVQTLSRAMDSRAEEIARSLVEVIDAESVLLKRDGPVRAAARLTPQRPHVLHGRPPRWTRVLELSARFTVDLQSAGTAFPYERRELHRLIRHISAGARVLDIRCGLGDAFIHAGLHGARSVLALEPDADQCELARENADANGLMDRAEIRCLQPVEALQALHEPFDLVMLHLSPADRDGAARLVDLTLLHARHGARLLMSARDAAGSKLEQTIAEACDRAGRIAWRIARPALPADFPTVLGAAEPDPLAAVVVQVS